MLNNEGDIYSNRIYLSASFKFSPSRTRIHNPPVTRTPTKRLGQSSPKTVNFASLLPDTALV